MKASVYVSPGSGSSDRLCEMTCRGLCKRSVVVVFRLFCFWVVLGEVAVTIGTPAWMGRCLSCNAPTFRLDAPVTNILIVPPRVVTTMSILLLHEVALRAEWPATVNGAIGVVPAEVSAARGLFLVYVPTNVPLPAGGGAGPEFQVVLYYPFGVQ